MVGAYRELDGSGADEDVASLMSPLNHTVNVVAVPRFVGRCQKTDFLPWLAAELRCRCGFNQTVWSCRYIGRGRCESHLSSVRWTGEIRRHHDGGFNLIDLLRVVDVERGSDAYSDSFDMDME